MLESILSGYRVIDLTQNVAGPFCTQILGDLGAEIIKVERPGTGDDSRSWVPPGSDSVAPMFLSLNRNKKSLCVDIGTEDGQSIIQRLGTTADILVHSMKPGSAEARGLGFTDLQRHNPKLIYCAISAFGETGPLRALPGYDPVMQAFTGLMSMTGNEGDDPSRVSVSLIDMGTGMWATIGILAACLKRHQTGKGVRVQASLLDTGLSWMSTFIISYLKSGVVPRKMGTAMANAAPYELFRSADGHVFIAACNDTLFTRVCKALGCTELLADPRYADNPSRLLNRQALHAAIEPHTRKRTSSANVAALRQAGAPCSEMNTLPQALDHQQVHATAMISLLDSEGHPASEPMVELPLRLDGSRSRAKNAPPGLGSHTDAVLLAAGYAPAEIAGLRGRAIIG